MNERQRALDLALTQIEKQFGKGSIMKLGEHQAKLNVDVIPTGILALDAALGVGGVPRGRIVEIYGPESSGKTTLGYHVVAEAQREGGVAAFIDAEHALNTEYARNVGVDIDNLLISQPDSGEQALEIGEMLVRSGAIDVIVVDSVAALVPRAELDGEMGDAHVGLQARLMSQAMRKLVGAISKSRTTMIFINQLREKVGVMFGNPEVTSGGRALKFYASVRMEIRRIETLKSGDQAIGQRVRIKVVKNKLAAPFRDCEADIIFPRGISKSASLLDVAALHGIVSRSGTWFAYKDMKIGQGRDNAREFLENNPELAREIDAKTREKLGIVRVPASAAAAPDAAPDGSASRRLVPEGGNGNGAAPEAKSPAPRPAVPTSVPSEDELRKVAGAAVVAKGVAPRAQR
ncbi:MAG TPA: recombinase RecA [bacterium]|nr:recombinase RecA [bacterium]